MEQVQKVRDEFKKFALSQPEFVKVCEKYGLPPGDVVGGLCAFAILLGIII